MGVANVPHGMFVPPKEVAGPVGRPMLSRQCYKYARVGVSTKWYWEMFLGGYNRSGWDWWMCPSALDPVSQVCALNLAGTDSSTPIEQAGALLG